MSDIKIGDFVRGISDVYTITNTKMTKGIVTYVADEFVKVKIIEHNDDCTGTYCVDPKQFEVIGHQKPFSRDEVLQLLKDGCKKAILDYNLRGADLRGANLSEADLNRADLDFSCFPLWCGGLHLKIDKRQACQLAYHLCSMQCDDEEYLKMRNSILTFANQFHRANECGILTEEVESNDISDI